MVKEWLWWGHPQLMAPSLWKVPLHSATSQDKHVISSLHCFPFHFFLRSPSSSSCPPYSQLFLCPTFLLDSPQDILQAALFFLRLEFIFLCHLPILHFSPHMSRCLLNPLSKPHLHHLFFVGARPSCFPFKGFYL